MRSKKRSEEHTSELQSHSNISYAVFCLKKKKKNKSPTASSCITESTSTRGGTRSCRTSSTFPPPSSLFFFFFNDTATTEIYTLLYTLSLHDALPISAPERVGSNLTRNASVPER